VDGGDELDESRGLWALVSGEVSYVLGIKPLRLSGAGAGGLERRGLQEYLAKGGEGLNEGEMAWIGQAPSEAVKFRALSPRPCRKTTVCVCGSEAASVRKGKFISGMAGGGIKRVSIVMEGLRYLGRPGWVPQIV
jgi:hypothetical protein